MCLLAVSCNLLLPVAEAVVWEPRQDVEVIPLFTLGLYKARHVYGDVEFVILELYLRLEISFVLR